MTKRLHKWALLVCLLLPSVAAAQSVAVPNFPTVSQLEAGFLSAFSAILTAQHGAAPTWSSTSFTQSTSGRIDFTAKFTIGSYGGFISAEVFDPVTAVPLGGGAYRFVVKSSWTCDSWNCSCDFFIREYTDGTREHHCNCAGTGGCTLTENDLSGEYSIRPSDYTFTLVNLQ